MTKKMLSFMSSVILALAIAVPAFAAETSYAEQSRASEYGYVIDDADLLTIKEWTSLSDQAEKIASTYPCDVCIAIVDDYTSFADDPVDACDES